MPAFRAIFKPSSSLSPTFTFQIVHPRIAPIINPSNPCTIATAHHFNQQRSNENRENPNNCSTPDVYSSTKLISFHAHNFRLDEALKLFHEMPMKDTVVWNAMIKGCLSCENMGMALKLFDEMPDRNAVSWTTIIDGYLRRGMIEEAEDMFSKMPAMAKDAASWNAMINGLFTNRRPTEAVGLFHEMPGKNVISWTTMISGLDQHGMSHEGLLFFEKMVRAGVKPTPSTYSCAVTCCASAGDLCLGSQVQAHALKLGCVLDSYVAASLVTLYAKCKRVEECVKAFDEKLHDNVVVWTALLTGYGLNSMHGDGLRVFRDMIRLKVIPNQSSFTSALNSSCEMEVVDSGRGIHGVAVKLGLEKDPFVGNSLVVMYTKCGNVRDGMLCFDEIRRKNVVSWNSIIVGCAQHGHGRWALAFFTRMTKTGLQPDEITFTGLLSSCSHSGMLEKGKNVFERISRFPPLEPKLEHYACMIDILCRNGRLDEAEGLIGKMPTEPNVSMWLTLLSRCTSDSTLDMAERVAKIIFEIDSRCMSAYVLLSNIYASARRWADAAKIRQDMKRAGTLRQPGRSWVVRGS